MRAIVVRSSCVVLARQRWALARHSRSLASERRRHSCQRFRKEWSLKPFGRISAVAASRSDAASSGQSGEAIFAMFAIFVSLFALHHMDAVDCS
eukprot:856095-Prorocentrum_minimum.AAC.2